MRGWWSEQERMLALSSQGIVGRRALGTPLINHRRGRLLCCVARQQEGARGGGAADWLGGGGGGGGGEV